MTEKGIISLCCVSIFAWTFQAIFAVHFLAFAFLAATPVGQRMRHDKNKEKKRLRL
jgi:hypothetical protein